MNRAESEWDPVELLLYAHEYLGLYCDFAFRFEERDESFGRIALSYLEGALECVQDAEASLRARLV
jgi:hypothetical protein